MNPALRLCSRAWRALLVTSICCLVVRGSLAAVDVSRRTFDVPAGDAGRSLKLFSQQAGHGVIAGEAAVSGVRTNAVAGEMTVREAVDRLLANTGLVATLDEKTGAFAVRKEAGRDEKKAPRVAQVTPGDRPRASRDAASLPEENAVELSPFVVNSTKDDGYQATSTLAGTRLNTPLKDLGAAISIYTQQFMEDIGATDSNTLMIFATSMEGGGPGGNFAGANNDINATELDFSATRGSGQTTRARGLAAPNYTRNFFSTSIAFDSYNTDGVTVNRGPNAMLFGVGSPAGVVETPLIRPDLQRNTNKVVMRYGNNDSLRESIDFNRVLIPRKLALRIAGLDDDEEYNQRPAYQKKQRIYGAVTYEPFKTTAIRANFEAGRTRANRPLTTLPVNSISQQWFAAGRQAYDWSFYDDPGKNPAAAAQVAGPAFEGPYLTVAVLQDHLGWVYSEPTHRTPDFAFRSTVPLNNAVAANSVNNPLFQPLVNRDLAADTIRFNATRNIAEFAAAYWTGANVLPGQQPNVPPVGIKRQDFTDLGAFDFNHHMLDESGWQRDTFHTFNLAFEQRAWRDRLGIELVYDTQRIDNRTHAAFFGFNLTNGVFLDTNVTLPTGQPNPNVGRPYTVGRPVWGVGVTDRESGRASGYLKYDFKELRIAWSRWLGRHTLSAVYEQDTTENVAYNYRLATDGDAARAVNPTIGSEARSPRPIVYMGPSIIGNSNPLRLVPIQVAPMAAGPAPVTARYFLRQANNTDPGAFVDSSSTFYEFHIGGGAQREVIKSQAAVLQSYWLQDYLITLVGWRRDEDYFIRQATNPVVNPADINDPGKVHYGLNDFSFPHLPPLNAAKEVKSYSAVLRWPRKLIALPAGTDFSVFYNQSENFTPTGGRINAFGEALPSPSGKTREYGFNFSALQDRLNVRINWFETSVTGQTLSNGLYSTVTNASVFGTADAWAKEGNVNPQLVAMRNADMELLFSPLPANYRQIYQWAISGTAPTISTFRTNLSGITDTTNYTAKGTEVELIVNPTRHWRVLANVSKQETVKNNSYPFLKHFISLMQPVWNQLKDRAWQNYPVGWRPGDPLPASVQTFGTYLDVNVLVPFATAIATDGSVSAEQRKWRANLITNYTFGRDSLFGEKLKGFGLGAAVRWQDKLGIGYPTSRDPDGTAHIDIAHPYYAPGDTNVDAWVSYERRIWSSRINWKVQLNATNVIGGTDPIAVGVQPWGEVASARIAPERRWYLTNTFSF